MTTKKNSSSKLIAHTVTVDRISTTDRDRMHALMEKYYEATPRAQFETDLNAKHAVILLRDDQKGEIQGFSTLLKRELQHKGKSSVGFFSGDTIVEKEFWGTRALGQEFLKFLWREKNRNPFRPVYWFLISKGYKTYLLMANNFSEHYPRYEKSTPIEIRELLNEFYTSLYPGKYDAETGRILFEKCVGKLREGVADTDPELIRNNERVGFFEKKNPGWKNGDELACIAQMTLMMPLKYQLKAIFKRNRQNRESSSARPVAQVIQFRTSRSKAIVRAYQARIE